jgi:hypothetical protein
MTETLSLKLTLVTCRRIYTDSQGDSHCDVVTVGQSPVQAAPPAAGPPRRSSP